MPRTRTRPQHRPGFGLCGCTRPEREHDNGCLWRLDRRESAGDRHLRAALADLQLRVTALEVKTNTIIDLRDGGLR